ncbi:hypothetical protein L5515_017094 [Caenorhabditis briggsae]|uniref:Uncharacterized protein n=1 Tax=Caenorhabditis briggsae TaxID=6238 RepID=A0AAE9JQD5_CAEBR|nr:hypothetical protein L5515_017094 [Caenorhabditis briggsae]
MSTSHPHINFPRRNNFTTLTTENVYQETLKEDNLAHKPADYRFFGVGGVCKTITDTFTRVRICNEKPEVRHCRQN